MKANLTTDLGESAPDATCVISWSAPPKNLVLGDEEVHVWRAALDGGASDMGRLHRTLAADERARAERFHFRRDRERFIVARALLRSILGRYLGVAPSQLRFAYSAHGKPSLARESGMGDLRFNLSHAGGLALYAITRGRDVGVDVERIRTDFANEQIAERFFSPREVAALRALSVNMQSQAFFNCWTRKEAYIKARGEGLSLPLDQFDVSLAPGEPVALLRTGSEPEEATRWSLKGLSPGSGYVAALAVRGHGWRLKCWQWSKKGREDDDKGNAARGQLLADVTERFS